MKITKFFLIIIFFQYCKLCFSQDSTAFSFIKVGLNYSNNFNRNEFHDLWKPSNGFSGILETPFYFGNINVGTRVLKYKGTDNSIPNFLSWYLFLGWNKEMNIFKKIKWSNGFNVGSFQMKFDDTDIDDGLIQESELALGLNSSIDYSISKNLSFNISGDYISIFTEKQINLLYFSLGVNYSFSTPIWIQDFLR